MVTGEDTDSRLVVLAVDTPVAEHVPAHVHTDEDQITVVIDGTVGATAGDDEILLTQGSVAFMPRAVAHAQWNAGDTPAKVLEIYTPAGFDLVFERAGEIAARQAPPTS